jgi:hypothetical protein
VEASDEEGSVAGTMAIDQISTSVFGARLRHELKEITKQRRARRMIEKVKGRTGKSGQGRSNSIGS